MLARSELLRVVLVQDVPALGSSGEIVQVRPGYARNLLVPRQLAVYASPENLLKHSPIIEAAKAKAAEAAAAVTAAELSAASSASAAAAASGAQPAAPQ